MIGEMQGRARKSQRERAAGEEKSERAREKERHDRGGIMVGRQATRESDRARVRASKGARERKYVKRTHISLLSASPFHNFCFLACLRFSAP